MLLRALAPPPVSKPACQLPPAKALPQIKPVIATSLFDKGPHLVPAGAYFSFPRETLEERNGQSHEVFENHDGGWGQSVGMRGQSWDELLPSSSFVFKGMKVSAKSVPGRLIYRNGAHTNGLSYHNIHRPLRTKHSHEGQISASRGLHLWDAASLLFAHRCHKDLTRAVEE